MHPKNVVRHFFSVFFCRIEAFLSFEICRENILAKEKSQNGDTLGTVELIVLPEQGNQGDWREQDGQGEVSIIIIGLSKVRSQRKKTILFGNFSQHGGGGIPKSQNFCKFTKYFFVCQIHSEVLKHVLQMGG